MAACRAVLRAARVGVCASAARRPAAAIPCLARAACTVQQPVVPARSLFTEPAQAQAVLGIRREQRDVGRNASVTARNAGLVPGRIYGVDSEGRSHNVNLWVRQEDLRSMVNTKKDMFLNTLFDLHVDGMVYRVLPRDLKRHPYKKFALSCDWMLYVPGRNPGVPMSIPTRPKNTERCTAYKQGGWALDLMYRVPVHVYGENIPQFLEVDFRGKAVGDKVMASEINLPAGVSLRHPDHDFAVVKFLGSRRGTLAQQQGK